MAQERYQTHVGGAAVELMTGDITQLDVDAFVYDITEDAKLGSGLGGAIQQRGGIAIQKALDAIGSIPTGTAAVTEAGLLEAEWIVYTNGPKFREVDEEGKLRAATVAALEQAEQKGAKTVALPPLGTGLYQVPVDLCAPVMVEAIRSYLSNGSALERVVIVAPDGREFAPFRSCLEEGA